MHIALVIAGNTKEGKTVEWVNLSKTGLGILLWEGFDTRLEAFMK